MENYEAKKHDRERKETAARAKAAEKARIRRQLAKQSADVNDQQMTDIAESDVNKVEDLVGVKDPQQKADINVANITEKLAIKQHAADDLEADRQQAADDQSAADATDYASKIATVHPDDLDAINQQIASIISAANTKRNIDKL
jgi:hypothetical protein